MPGSGRGAEGSAASEGKHALVEGYRSWADLAERTPGTRLVYVADREGDLRELMDTAARRGTPADWLLRAKHNRSHPGGRQDCGPVGQSEPVGEVEFMLPARTDGRHAWYGKRYTAKSLPYQRARARQT